jgi:hypothetical protein
MANVNGSDEIYDKNTDIGRGPYLKLIVGYDYNYLKN